MAKVYYRRTKLGLMTIDQVPNLWRKKVEEMLAEDATAEQEG